MRLRVSRRSGGSIEEEGRWLYAVRVYLERTMHDGHCDSLQI